MVVQRMLGLLNVEQPASLSVAASAVRGLLEGDTAEPPPPPPALLPPPEAALAHSVGAGRAEEGSQGGYEEGSQGGYATASVGAKRKAEQAPPEERPALRRVRALVAEECTQVSPVSPYVLSITWKPEECTQVSAGLCEYPATSANCLARLFLALGVGPACVRDGAIDPPWLAGLFVPAIFEHRSRTRKRKVHYGVDVIIM